MIRINTTETNMTDRQTAEFMLDIFELADKDNSLVSDIRFRSKTSQARELIRLKRERERFSNALGELVEICNRLKSLASMASGDQIDKLIDEVEALKSLSVSMENGENEDCRNNYCTITTGCESK
jgi:hypothetical protein